MTAARLVGRRVLVCGGATGIGAATAWRIAAEGAAVLVHYRTRDAEARALCDELRASGADADALQADLTVDADVARLAREAGDVHGIVHSVSPPLPRASIADSDWATFQAHWDAGAGALYLLARHVVPTAPSLTSIAVVLTSAVVGVPPKDMAAYVTGKHALLGLCKALAVELAPRGIRVNGVSPGMTPTPLTAHVDPRFHEILGRGVPLGRLGTAADTAAVIAFLLSDDAAFVTGANVPVSGGATM